ncbi:phosphoribosyltransferase [Streptomyces sp. NPDC101118]|uniref:phosphoribosyltransferase n=1 Tax=unclassified Streptomyces TaxID=2593676 RepID=UPI0037D2D282
MATRFTNRQQAGRQLAERVAAVAAEQRWKRPLVLALPRGGVPVGAEVAEALHAPLDVLVARKIGAPGHSELGIGAIVDDDPPLFDPRSLEYLGLTEDELAFDVARERIELRRREALYRGIRVPPEVRGRTVVLVDDGLATGVTARAALRHLRGRDPARLVLAVPVAAPEALVALSAETDEVICLSRPQPFHAVGLWYEDFEQTTDREVTALLGRQPVTH